MVARALASVWNGLASFGLRWLCALLLVGCAQLPRIDPNGDRLFIWPGETQPPVGVPSGPLAPATTTLGPPSGTLQLPGPPSGPPAGPTPAPAARPGGSLALRASGPSQAAKGATFSYRLEITNPSDRPVSDVVVRGQDPPGLELVSSNPPSASAGRNQQWRLGELAPRGSATVEVDYRIEQTGELRYCVELSSAAGVAARDCITTRIVAGAPAAVQPPPDAAMPVDPLEVAINGPTSAEVGTEVSFDIRVTNRGTGTLKGLLVHDQFGEGLRHARAASPIEHDLVDLPPGGVGSLTVTFQVTQPGQLCQDVTITADGGLRSTARNCLTATEAPGAEPPAAAATEPEQTPASNSPLSIKQTVAPRQRVGEVARFRVDVTNTSAAAIENLEIGDNFETSLEPRQATEGSTWLKGDVLGWKVATLEPGKTIRREVEFKCLRETPRACNRVTVSADGIEAVADEACLEIVSQAAAAPPVEPAAGNPLSVSVADTADPIKVDGETTYQIVLTNNSQQSLFDVAVTATFSDEVKLAGLSGPVHGAVLPNTVRFDPIREIRGGESPLSFELRVKGVRPGTARLRVDVTSRGQTKPISAEQGTEILPPR